MAFFVCGYTLGYNAGQRATAPGRRSAQFIDRYHYPRLVIPMDTMENIKQQIADNAILLYMKGSPNAPQCGFSMRASQALMACGKRFAYVDVLSNPDIRSELPKYANWPTFPQLWVKGELVGGCDIIMEMYESGELKTLVEEASAESEDGE